MLEKWIGTQRQTHSRTAHEAADGVILLTNAILMLTEASPTLLLSYLPQILLPNTGQLRIQVC